MTTYTAILNTETDPGKPVKSDLAKRWSDNWIAGFEGATGAPKLNINSLERLSVGNVVKSRIDAEETSIIVGTTGGFTVSFLQVGTVRFTAEWKSNGAATVTQRLQRIRQGVTTTMSSVNTSSSVYQPFSVDVDVTPGDTFTMSTIATSNTSHASRNRRMSTDGLVNFWPAAGGVNIEGNVYT